MAHVPRWIHISLEAVGAVAVAGGIGWLLLWLFFIYPMRNFAGGNCTDSEKRILASPDGKRTVKSFHRACEGNDTHPWDFVYLSTGNSNAGYEYTPIATIKNIAPGQLAVEWSGSEEVVVSFPSTAELDDVYAKVLGVTVVLHPRER